MKLHMAAFDPDGRLANHKYWRCSAGHIPESVLNDAYYSYLREAVITHDNSPNRKSSLCGMALMSNGWGLFYRIVNAGRDTHGRPGRFIIVCAFAKRGDIFGQDPDGVWNAPQLTDLAAAAERGELGAAINLDSFELDYPIDRADPIAMERLLKQEALPWPQSGSWMQFLGVCAKLPANLSWAVKVLKDRDTWSATIRQMDSATPASVELNRASTPPTTERRSSTLSRLEKGHHGLLIAALVACVIAAALAGVAGLSRTVAWQNSLHTDNRIPSSAAPPAPIMDNPPLETVIAVDSGHAERTPVQVTLVDTANQMFLKGAGVGFLAGFAVCGWLATVLWRWPRALVEKHRPAEYP